MSEVPIYRYEGADRERFVKNPSTWTVWATGKNNHNSFGPLASREDAASLMGMVAKLETFNKFEIVEERRERWVPDPEPVE